MIKTVFRVLAKKDTANSVRPGVAFTAVLFLSLCFTANGQETKQGTNANTSAAAGKGDAPSSQKIVQQGIAIEFSVKPIAGNAVMESEDALVQFKVSDTSTGTPMTGLNLSAWMKQREAGKAADVGQCKEMVRSFLQGSLRSRSDVDLNSYYILALNDEPNISVIDPLLGFGGSKLMTLVLLKSPGAAWVMTGDQRFIFVTMPLVNEVAVVDLTTWKVVSNIPVGTGATQLALQPDEKYLWVADGNSQFQTGALTAIDTATLKAVGRIQMTGGNDKIAFSPDSRFVLAGNESNGSVTVIDVAKMVKIRDIKIGRDIAALQFSPLSKAFYAVSEIEGTITVIDAAGERAAANMKIKPGIGGLSFAPGGRYGFVVNSKENEVTIFDASTNRLVQTIVVGKTPNQVVFSDAFAYVRSANSEEVNLIRLSTIGKELDVTMFPGGQLAPGKLSAGDTIVPAPDGAAMLVANPADKVIYYYSEGMAAPMGNFQNYRRTPRSIKIADRSLRETNPGLYTTTVRLPKSGEYDVAFLADSPRVTHCFEAKAIVNPAKKAQQQNGLRIEHLIKDRTLEVNKSMQLRFKLLNAATNEPKENLKDVRVLAYLTPGIWQKRNFARSVGLGVYEIDLNVPQSGIYMVFVEVPSQGISFRQLTPLTLHAADQSVSTADGEMAKP